MELHEAHTRYPDLMSYIASRNSSAAPKDWCAQLRIDEAAALRGELAAVADALRQARADYAQAHPQNPYPYNRSMGEYLGLPIRANSEPDRGYYMAGQVEVYDALGRAKQTAAALIGGKAAAHRRGAIQEGPASCALCPVPRAGTDQGLRGRCAP